MSIRLYPVDFTSLVRILRCESLIQRHKRPSRPGTGQRRISLLPGHFLLGMRDVEEAASVIDHPHAGHVLPVLLWPADATAQAVAESTRGSDPVLSENRPDRPRSPLSDAYSEILRRHAWHWFATLTFRPDRCGRTGGMHPEAADKAFRFFVSCLNRELYGAKWSKRWHGGLQWARGTEFHKDGRLHFHAVLSSPSNDLSQLASRYDWHEFWYREFGRNQLEVPRCQEDISGYVSKYVAKGGEVDFSKNFGAWEPPAQTFAPAPAQTRLPVLD